jgi:hypothetical protein
MNQRELELVVAAAGLAPRLADTQAWRFVVAGHTLQLRTDENALDILSARRCRIDCGAAAEFAQIYMLSLGYACTARILPNADDPSLLVTLTEGGRQLLTPTQADSAEALRNVISRPESPATSVMAPRLLNDLRAVADERRCWIKVLGWDLVPDLELRLGAALPALSPEAFISESHLIVLGSDNDDVASQIRIGRALAMLTLRLGSVGFQPHVGVPVADVPGASAVLERTLSLIGTPQILFAVGTTNCPTTDGLGLGDQVSKVVFSA